MSHPASLPLTSETASFLNLGSSRRSCVGKCVSSGSSRRRQGDGESINYHSHSLKPQSKSFSPRQLVYTFEFNVSNSLQYYTLFYTLLSYAIMPDFYKSHSCSISVRQNIGNYESMKNIPVCKPISVSASALITLMFHISEGAVQCYHKQYASNKHGIIEEGKKQLSFVHEIKSVPRCGRQKIYHLLILVTVTSVRLHTLSNKI